MGEISFNLCSCNVLIIKQYTLSLQMHRAYKAHIISTIVDVLLSSIDACAYKAHIISTIVDA